MRRSGFAGGLPGSSPSHLPLLGRLRASKLPSFSLSTPPNHRITSELPGHCPLSWADLPPCFSFCDVCAFLVFPHKLGGSSLIPLCVPCPSTGARG